MEQCKYAVQCCYKYGDGCIKDGKLKYERRWMQYHLRSIKSITESLAERNG